MAAPEHAPPARPRFRRVLWCRQPFPDNYQDASFLEHIHRNPAAQRTIYTYPTLVLSSLPLCAHLSSVMIFIGLFVYLYEHVIDSRTIIWFTIVLGLIGYFVWERSKPERSQSRGSAFRSAGILIFLLMLLSPVLRTLTLSTASDSIWALAAVLLIINILLGDYRDGRESLAEGSLDVSFPSALSLNAAIFASVVLASRLPSDLDVFALLLFSVEWYALFPLMRRDVMRKYPNSLFRPVVLNISLAGLACLTAMSLSTSVGFIYLMTVPLGTAFGLPAIYVWAQRYKRDLRGPWDCAVPRLS